jgi:glycerol-3-phosphate dehydrogenase
MDTLSRAKLEPRYRVVILGGGIHGVGIAHDLASRGWRDVLVVEKSLVGSGTSAKSTKLIHGGLRYLQHPRDFPLVAEGLEERALLAKLAPDIVKPLPFIFPVLKKGGMPRFMVKIGLWLYDALSLGRSLGRHRWLLPDEAFNEAPVLDKSMFKGFYRFFDGQTDDLELTMRVAQSAEMLGATVVENMQALSVSHTATGWNIVLKTGDETTVVNTKYLVNALGPWAHEFLDASHIKPKVEGINNQGTHLLIRDLGLKSGLFLQSPEDSRIFFILPWKGYTLIGTTEDIFEGQPDDCRPEEHQINYLLERCNRFLSLKLSMSDVIKTFSGMRWLAKDPKSGLSDTSRSHLVTEHVEGADVMYTLYGGKLTAYRALSKEVAEKIAKAFGDSSQSKTHLAETWAPPRAMPVELNIPERFSKI